MVYAASTFFRFIPLKQIRLDISYSESSGGVCSLLMTEDSGGISSLTFVKKAIVSSLMG